jgi:hypothetical protein
MESASRSVGSTSTAASGWAPPGVVPELLPRAADEGGDLGHPPAHLVLLAPDDVEPRRRDATLGQPVDEAGHLGPAPGPEPLLPDRLLVDPDDDHPPGRGAGAPEPRQGVVLGGVLDARDDRQLEPAPEEDVVGEVEPGEDEARPEGEPEGADLEEGPPHARHPRERSIAGPRTGARPHGGYHRAVISPPITAGWLVAVLVLVLVAL